MPRLIEIQNRQRRLPVSGRAFRAVAEEILSELGCADYELGVHFVGAQEMARINETFLGHTGSTDVITFDHSNGSAHLHGELFICTDDAVAQSVEFRTSSRQELLRYLIHGILHLKGFDDLQPDQRKQMKRKENALVRQLTATIEPVTAVAKPSRRSTSRARQRHG